MTEAKAIRDAVATRLAALPGFVKFRKAPFPILHPQHVPSLTVSILGVSRSPDGDGNVGEPRFMSEVTIGVSVVRGFERPEALDDQIDADVDAIEVALLTDATFVGFDEDALFEEVTAFDWTRTLPKNGETEFVELQLTMKFRTRVYFEPAIPDDYERLRLTARPAPADEDTPAITVEIDQNT